MRKKIRKVALLLEDWMEEAYSRLADAKQWFTHHPQHPLHAERIVVELIFLQKELTNKIHMEEQAINIQNIKMQFKGQTRKKLQNCRNKVMDFAQTFSEEQAQLQYCKHHRVEQLIKVFVLEHLSIPDINDNN